MLLKREIGPESWAVEAVVGAVLHGRESASLGQTQSSHVGRKFRFEFALNSHHLGHDRATMWSWPSVDRRLIDWQRFPHVNPPIAARSRRDRGSIGPRSWSSSTIGLRRRIEIQVIVIRTIAVLRAIRCRPHDGDRTHQEAPRVAQIANDRSHPMNIR